MARLPYPDPAALDADTQALLKTLPPLNIFRMLSGSGAIFRPFMELINAYLNNGHLQPRLRELVILRVGHLCGSTYEIHQHERVSKTLGIDDRLISAMAKDDLSTAETLTSAEQSALVFTDLQVAQVKVPGEITDNVRHHLGDAGLQELIVIVGIYMLVCRYLETLEIDFEEHAIEGSGLDEIRNSFPSLP